MEQLTDLSVRKHFENKPVLVTGAAGFIGRHLVRGLDALGADITAVDVARDNQAPPGVRWVTANVLELTPEDLGVSSIETVFHLAAVVGVSYATHHPIQTVAVNAAGTGRILRLARGLGAGTFCLLSSSEVYGEPETLPIVEESPLAPRSTYGWSKLCAEQLLEALVDSRDVRGVTIRPFNVFGPGQRSEFVVSRFIERAAHGLPPVVAGDGTQERVFTFVDDLIEGILLAVARGTPGYHIYNIAGDEPVSIMDLAERIVALSGHTVRPIRAPLEELDRDPGVEVRMRVPSIAKARTQLGYQPHTDLEHGLAQTLAATAEH